MLINLPHLGLLQISGPDAKKLLQGQLTCNLDEITPTQSRLGAHCNPQGRILSLFRAFWYQDSYYLQMPAEILPDAITALKKYAVFFKVQLKDVSDSLMRVSYSGTEVADSFPVLPENIDSAITTGDILIIKLTDNPANYEIIVPTSIMMRSHGGGGNGNPDIADAVRNFLDCHAQATSNLAMTDDAINQWKLSNITAGIPTIYTNTRGKILPHEINLQQLNAISFNKGCYTGQEIIARMHYRGQLKKQMYRARVKTTRPPQPGADLHPSGIIVDSCQEQHDIYQILVVVNQNDKETQQLFLDPAKIEPLEFVT